MKIVPVFLRYGYGIKSRGDSLEYRGFCPVLKQIAEEVCPFWFDEYLDKREKLQKKVVEFIDDKNPDVVFFMLMKDEFSFNTLDYLKNRYTTINWFCDDQWRFENFTRYYAPHFSYAITTDKFALSKYKKIGYENAILSQWASFGHLENLENDDISYKYDVSFVGMFSGYRKWIVKELLKRGIKVECFGYGWKNGIVSYKEMTEIFKTSKINLNISNSVSYDIRCVMSSIKSLRELAAALLKGSRKTAEQIKARNFEIPAFGGFQLSNYIPSLEDYFEVGKQIAVYISIEDLGLQIKYYLDNEKERKTIMIDGYKKAAKEHLYSHRLKSCFRRMNIKL